MPESSTPEDELARRTTELEFKLTHIELTHIERTLEVLDGVVVEQQRRLDHVELTLARFTTLFERIKRPPEEDQAP